MMSAYVDAELTGAEMLEIRRHLAGCRECANEHESIRLMKHAVSRLRTVAPREDFAHFIIARLDEVRIPGYQRVLNSVAVLVHKKLSPVAAALAASGLALVVLSAGGMDDVAQEVNSAVAGSSLVARAGEINMIPGSNISLRPQALEIADTMSYGREPVVQWTSLGR
ncbi:MAG: hypothetical protein A2Z18_01870 [Armatimonadetes bacterium RBG_16_58_9]|nr:MAG: hypothetical protein A2Z18_01870 [Armatimonadetes bacterium RBG_16_58_9]